jgi:hypothetical protein
LVFIAIGAAMGASKTWGTAGHGVAALHGKNEGLGET